MSGPGRAVGRCQRMQFGAIAEPGAGAVALDHADLFGLRAGCVKHAPEQPGLGVAARRGHALGAAVGVHAAGQHLGQYRVSVAVGHRAAGQHEHRRPLGPHRAAGLRAVRAAVSVVGQCVLLGEFDEVAGRAEHADPAGQRDVAVAAAHRGDRDVQRGQPTGAGRVDRQRGSAEPQHVGDASGDRAERGAGEQMPAVGRVFGEITAVPEVRGPDVASDVFSGQGVGVDARVLQCPPAHPQRNPLLRVDRDGFPR